MSLPPLRTSAGWGLYETFHKGECADLTVGLGDIGFRPMFPRVDCALYVVCLACELGK